ncbi:hypothetical protein ANASTE_00712 [Anaerofustis stercorihominis DSM 17244]|uniref:Ribbon-helix-helix protein, CopG family n=1 Tax=Anaerofustis stercorihominis DSM 17244 TaxID=445971 RepID=B1C7L0_9FIRM|nr:hypothetical protein [Anaerofustis stercorihominis]EDS72997.1 hypothetical protein ANASTE_00712 [Anaerofustis stercorihominis DSM 17244]
MSKKIGRPTNNPKPYKLGVRLNEKDKKILDLYCEQYEVNKSEAVSAGIKKLETDIKK